MTTVISVENLSKSYRLGQIGTGTLTNDLKVWAARVRGKPNPLLKIGQVDHGNQVGETIWALKEVSFQVEQGDVLGIIGRNGAGKSTLLKILSRVTAPSSGCVKVKGRIASLLEVGTGFHPDLTGRENIYLNGAILGMNKQEISRKFDEIVNFAEIEKFIDTPVKRYSSGMYVRLAFAVAAHLESEILLVDEVLAVGDAEFQKKCLGKMGDVASKEGRTVLFVSHNMGSIGLLCPSTIVISKGSIICMGETKYSIDYYINNANYENRNLPLSQISANQNFRISLLSFLNKNGNQVPGYQMGDDVFIQFEFISKSIFNNLIVTIGINDQFGARITVLHSSLSGYKLEQKDYKTTVTCITKNIKLLPGKYSLDVKVYKGNETLLWHENISSLIIEPGNVLGTGKLPPKEWGGYFIVDQEWKVK